jgi:hypothetical protein
MKASIFKYLGCGGLAWLVSGGIMLLGVLILLITELFSLSVGPQMKNTQKVSIAQFGQLPTSTEVTVSGYLMDNPMLIGTDLVALISKQHKQDSSGDWHWEIVGSTIPDLTLADQAGEITIHSDSKTWLIDEDLNKAIILKPDINKSSEFDYWGLRNGELITVLGTKSADGSLLAKEISKGTYENLEKNLVLGMSSMKLVPIFLGMGVLFVGLAFLYAGNRRDLSRH